jgi:hypothetical protein
MTTTYEPNVVLAREKFDVVGTRPIRHDGAVTAALQAKNGG